MSRSKKKVLFEFLLFLSVMLFTFWYLFRAQNITELVMQIKKLSFLV